MAQNKNNRGDASWVSNSTWARLRVGTTQLKVLASKMVPRDDWASSRIKLLGNFEKKWRIHLLIKTFFYVSFPGASSCKEGKISASRIQLAIYVTKNRSGHGLVCPHLLPPSISSPIQLFLFQHVCAAANLDTLAFPTGDVASPPWPLPLLWQTLSAPALCLCKHSILY